MSAHRLGVLNLSEPPEGGRLSLRSRRNGVIEVRFDAPAGFGVRFLLLSILLLAWWIAWLFAFAVALTMIVTLAQGKEADATGQILGLVLVLAWLLGWGYGGMVLARSLYRILKGREVLVLAPDFALYRSGRPEDEPPVWRFWSGGVSVARNMFGGVRIENTSGGRRLALTVGSQRMFIGENLDSKDLQWLHHLLSEWRRQS